MCLPDPEIVVFVTLVSSTVMTVAAEETGLFLFVVAFVSFFLRAGWIVVSSSVNAAAVSLMYALITARSSLDKQ